MQMDDVTFGMTKMLQRRWWLCVRKRIRKIAKETNGWKLMFAFCKKVEKKNYFSCLPRAEGGQQGCLTMPHGQASMQYAISIALF